MVCKLLGKKPRDACRGAGIISENQQLVNELHKPITHLKIYSFLR